MNIKAIDTTGAGDAFHAGFVTGLIRNLSFEDSLKFATKIAGLKCQITGPRIPYNALIGY